MPKVKNSSILEILQFFKISDYCYDYCNQFCGWVDLTEWT